MKELQEIFKELEVSLKGEKENTYLKYSYITLEQIKKLIAPKLKEKGILFVPEILEVNSILIGEKNDRIMTTCKIKMRFIKGDEEFSFITFGQGEDNQGKSLAKATTDGIKRALSHMFMLAVQEEDEDDTYGAGNYRPATEPQKALITKLITKAGLKLEDVMKNEKMDWDHLSMDDASKLIQKYGNK